MEFFGVCPPSPRVAIVGSRAAHRWAVEAAGAAVRAARDAGFSVVSGGAVGVDVAAHRAALALGVPQLAVLPLGVDRPYPPQHKGLYRELVASPSSSGVLYAQPRGTTPTRAMFATRNQVVVEHADAVIVVQAGLRSGTLGTGELALRRGKAVGAVPGSAGTARLVALGASWLAAEAAEAGPTRTRWIAAMAEVTARWLAHVSDPSQPLPTFGSRVPEHLRALVDEVRAAGSGGFAPDESATPVLACAQLAEAEGLGIVTPAGGGRYVLGPAAHQGDGAGSKGP